MFGGGAALFGRVPVHNPTNKPVPPTFMMAVSMASLGSFGPESSSLPWRHARSPISFGNAIRNADFLAVSFARRSVIIGSTLTGRHRLPSTQGRFLPSIRHLTFALRGRQRLQIVKTAAGQVFPCAWGRARRSAAAVCHGRRWHFSMGKEAWPPRPGACAPCRRLLAPNRPAPPRHLLGCELVVFLRWASCPYPW